MELVWPKYRWRDRGHHPLAGQIEAATRRHMDLRRSRRSGARLDPATRQLRTPRNLKHAVDNLGGLFRVVVAKAKDVDASHRAIEDCFPQPNLIMKIIELDRETGEFTASGPN